MRKQRGGSIISSDFRRMKRKQIGFLDKKY